MQRYNKRATKSEDDRPTLLIDIKNDANSKDELWGQHMECLSSLDSEYQRSSNM